MRSKKATPRFVANFLLKSFLKRYFGSPSAKKNRVRTLCGLRHSKSLHFVYFVLEGLVISRSKWRHIFTQLSVKTLVEVTPDIGTNVRECNLLDNLVNYIILAKTIVEDGTFIITRNPFCRLCILSDLAQNKFIMGYWLFTWFSSLLLCSLPQGGRGGGGLRIYGYGEVRME